MRKQTNNIEIRKDYKKPPKLDRLKEIIGASNSDLYSQKNTLSPRSSVSVSKTIVSQ